MLIWISINISSHNTRISFPRALENHSSIQNNRAKGISFKNIYLMKFDTRQNPA